jgi:hypothetical protein
MKLLGRIARLQLQRSSLKRIEDGRKVYDPAPLLAVAELILTRSGACARLADGSMMVDVHNAAHPATRNDRGVNPLSLLFTSHYARMQERFGPHLRTGCAGESILVETDEVVPLADVVAGVTVQTTNGPVVLGQVIVAAPCAPFSVYALQHPGASTAALKATLQFLDHGTRGFYCQFTGDAPATIAVGDCVYATPPHPSFTVAG